MMYAVVLPSIGSQAIGALDCFLLHPGDIVCCILLIVGVCTLIAKQGPKDGWDYDYTTELRMWRRQRDGTIEYRPATPEERQQMRDARLSQEL